MIIDKGLGLNGTQDLLDSAADYIDFIKLTSSARIVLTDSGGIQEETTVLGVPCVTIRDNTERPCTIHEGTNLLAGTSPEGIRAAFDKAMAARVSESRPKFWDGHAAERIADEMLQVFGEMARGSA